jgi:hypothetical protein
MVGGLRYEQHRDRRPRLPSTTSMPTTRCRKWSRDYDKLLPSLHFRFELDADTICAGPTRRPEPPELHRHRAALVISDDDREAEAGNPNLEGRPTRRTSTCRSSATCARSACSRWRPSTRTGRPDLHRNSIIGSGDDGLPPDPRRERREGRITGLELAWQQTFDRLPSPFDGLGVYANYTYADSERRAALRHRQDRAAGHLARQRQPRGVLREARLQRAPGLQLRSKYIQEFDVRPRASTCSGTSVPCSTSRPATSWAAAGRCSVRSTTSPTPSSAASRASAIRVLELEAVRTLLAGRPALRVLSVPGNTPRPRLAPGPFPFKRRPQAVAAR